MPSWTAGKPAVVNLLLVLADNKYWLGRHLSEWAVGSPSLEVGVACAAVEQGSWARRGSCTRCWRSYPSQDRSTRPLAVAALLLVDTAVTIMLEALRDGRYQALAQRVPRMLEEERFHWDFAEGRVHELVRLPPPREEPEVTVPSAVAVVSRGRQVARPEPSPALVKMLRAPFTSAFMPP